MFHGVWPYEKIGGKNKKKGREGKNSVERNSHNFKTWNNITLLSSLCLAHSLVYMHENKLTSADTKCHLSILLLIVCACRSSHSSSIPIFVMSDTEEHAKELSEDAVEELVVAMPKTTPFEGGESCSVSSATWSFPGDSFGFFLMVSKLDIFSPLLSTMLRKNSKSNVLSPLWPRFDLWPWFPFWSITSASCSRWLRRKRLNILSVRSMSRFGSGSDPAWIWTLVSEVWFARLRKLAWISWNDGRQEGTCAGVCVFVFYFFIYFFVLNKSRTKKKEKKSQNRRKK